MTRMTDLRSAKAFLSRHFPNGGQVLCAVSGGLDSMCLLAFLTAQPEFTVTAAHFNHGLRGETADRDEAFVREYCREHGIAFVSGRGDTPALAADGHTVEEAARILRYDFLRTAAAEQGCEGIFTAHHADDNAETLLLHLLRGTGSAGLAGIPAAENGVYRPFLQITRAELEVYAEKCGIPHVEDETNEADDASRNVLRHRVLPVLRQLNPKAVENMSRTAAIVAGENRLLEDLAEREAEQAKQTPDGWRIPIAVFADHPGPLAERTALILLERAAGHRRDLTHSHVEAVLALCETKKKQISLPYGLTARRDGECLYIEKTPLPPDGGTLMLNRPIRFGDWTVTVAETPSSPTDIPLCVPPDAVLTVTAWHCRMPGAAAV